MKREIAIHFLAFLVLFFLTSLIRGWWSMDLGELITFLPFWLGGILGTVLPDIDHLIYVYFLRPQELTSQRVNFMTSNGNVKGAISLLYSTRSERTSLIFHTAFFQIIFFILTFLVVTSSSGLLGRGLVLAFCLHLLVDQVVDLASIGSISANWFKNFPISLDLKNQRTYVLVVAVLILVFAFLF